MTQLKFIHKTMLAGFILMLFCTPLHAEDPFQDAGTIIGGAGQITSGVVALPTEILKGAVQSFPFGILAGAIRGTFMTLGGVLGGALNVARGAAPYAKYAAFI